MRVAVLGSGGIGGYYGALLKRSGHDVAFIARGAHLEAMQRRGLTVRTPEGQSTIPVTASADTASVGTVDLVLFSVKSQDTETAAQARSGIGPLLASAAGRSLLHAACGKIVAVAQAEGALLQPAAVDAVLAQAATLPAPWRSSMARDLEEGRRLEVDALSGAVVRRGLKQGIPTPVHQTIVACLSVHQPSASTTQEPHARSAIRA